MTTTELVKLKEGIYTVTDKIRKYTIEVGYNKNKSKYYDIRESGSSRFSASIFITQHFEKDDGNKIRVFNAMAGVGGLRIHSSDIFGMLNYLEFVK